MANNTIYYFDYSPYFPDPVTCFWEFSVTFSRELNNRFPWNGVRPWFKETWQAHYMAFYVNSTDVWNTVLMALFLTLLRMFLNFALLKRIPRWLGLGKRDGEKFPESVWKLLVYSVTWSWAIYICFFTHPQYFFELRSHWEFYSLGREILPSEYWLYILQMGFYIHCAYASVFIETIRKDFAVLMIHHFLTLGLLGYSLAVRFHPIGLLVLFVQDVGDICLESAKTVVYCKVRNGVKYTCPGIIADVLFAIFTIEWIIFRLYWYPTKVLYSSGVVCLGMYADGPFYLSFNVMLLFLYGMQVYWFGFIVKLLVKMAMGQTEVEDTREYDEDG